MTQATDIIDNIPNDVLIHVILNSNNFTWNFFALKIILTRLNLKIVMCKGDTAVFPECCAELKRLLKQSVSIPNSQADLKKILSISQ